jgi:hypothetical protein
MNQPQATGARQIYRDGRKQKAAAGLVGALGCALKATGGLKIEDRDVDTAGLRVLVQQTIVGRELP